MTFLTSCYNPFEPEPTAEELIEERVNTFLTAYNDGDINTVLECLDAKSRNTLQSMLNIWGALVGGLTGFSINLSDLFSLGASTSSGDFMKLEITDITIVDSENDAKVSNFEISTRKPSADG